MKENILSQIMELQKIQIDELKKKYDELFGGKKAPSNNKIYLWRRIAYRIQELEYSGLSDKAQNKIKKLIEEYNPVNNKELRSEKVPVKKSMARDRRLPIPGTIIIKEYKGTNIQVKVLEKGFEYKEKIYKSLTAVAEEITGQHWNGYIFFGL